MNIRFKVFASYNILQCLCDFIHVLKYICNCLKMSKKSQINEYSDYNQSHLQIQSNLTPQNSVGNLD
jgi:hypothetical protein